MSTALAPPYLAALLWGLAALPSGAATGDYVVLLHGMGRSPTSMQRMASHLAHSGFVVVNAGYPSTTASVQQIADTHLARILREDITNTGHRIHFVTHSLGGIVVRAYLQNHTITNLGRVVMLSPPNQGSELADHLKSNPLYRHATGPAGQELGVGTGSVPCQLGPVDFDLGVITGDRTWNPWFSYVVPGADDGKVSVERAKVAGMKDFLVVHASHTWIMQRGEVIRQVIHFLHEGAFERPPAPSTPTPAPPSRPPP